MFVAVLGGGCLGVEMGCVVIGVGDVGVRGVVVRSVGVGVLW